MSMPKSARTHKRIAVALVSLTLGLLGGVAPATAEASAQTQGLCSSKGSVIGSVIEIHDIHLGHITALLKRGECTWIQPGGARLVYRGAKSYRVAYNFGPYSKDCRDNNDFIPYKKANPIYLKLYTSSSCVNP